MKVPDKDRFVKATKFRNLLNYSRVIFGAQRLSPLDAVLYPISETNSGPERKLGIKLDNKIFDRVILDPNLSKNVTNLLCTSPKRIAINTM
ncbi:MAG: hypothetical protein RLZZ241_1347 [Bacteroidota bacterium]|jgi:hypothetical protein